MKMGQLMFPRKGLQWWIRRCEGGTESDRKTFQVLALKDCSEPGPLGLLEWGVRGVTGFLHVEVSLGLASHLTHIIE